MRKMGNNKENKYGSKLIRKRPTIKTLSHKTIKSTIYVKSSSPYISVVKRVHKFIEQLNKTGRSPYVRLMGIGKAVEKTLSIACHFQEEKGRRVDVKTISVDVIDELQYQEDHEEQEEEIENDEDRETVLKKRSVSGVEVKIYLAN
ncbi:ribonuclease P/MRP protein subunit POP7 NDAI_0C05840 [Naumovozyma dairenensis CBS 421]|uniref:Uncharacterized protein n=1 Tax=Naumovozyma dairenensis (strain ATCC 10597 / BCRC 20456 / CBS 421 / NBRC 0211 / NRRL Y-12639) TaxID=1071378 RepID=G0W8Y2_NAUDC|nr:hypothetical protein NDAI_0C05840 [Naumovozyma dairenensis CBS 421]CCD24243.1 hypothetical protein NDAI_0C05840 [Naumovozyma dairenensis CBS 421]